jgi:hypothetical protein
VSSSSGRSSSTWFSPTSNNTGLDALLCHGLAVHERHAVGLFVQRDGRVEVSTATPMWSIRANMRPDSV